MKKFVSSAYFDSIVENGCLLGENICRSFLGKNTLSLAALKGLIPPLLKKDWLLIQYKENFQGKKVLFY